VAYIRINRKLFDHIFWKENRVYSRAEAWIDLIQLVSFTPNNKKMVEGVVINWGRGQYPISHSFLSQRWNWSTHKVRIFIDLLKTAGQVTTITAWKATILTLCKYDVYNPISQADVQAEGQADVQADGRKYNKDKEFKEDKVEKEKEKEIFDFKKQEEEEYEKWRIENDKRNEEFMRREDEKEERERNRDKQPEGF
jgi:phage-related minor tail protein